MAENNLKARRVEIGMTQEAVAARLGISQQHYARLESGTTAAKIAVAKELSELFSLPIETLFPQTARMIKADHAALEDFRSSDYGVGVWDRAGIDLDDRTWIVSWSISPDLAGRPYSAVVSSATAASIAETLRDKSVKSGVLVFDDRDHRHALRIGDDVIISVIATTRDHPEPDQQPDGDVLLRVRGQTVRLPAVPDEVKLYSGPGRCDMQLAYAMLESGTRPRIAIPVFPMTDEANMHYVPAAGIEYMRVHLSVVDPALRAARPE